MLKCLTDEIQNRKFKFFLARLREITKRIFSYEKKARKKAKRNVIDYVLLIVLKEYDKKSLREVKAEPSIPK